MRRVYPLLVLVLGHAGCREEKPAPKPVPSASASAAKPVLIPQNRTKAHDIESLVTAWNDAINAHDAEKLAALYADEIDSLVGHLIDHPPPGLPPVDTQG